MFKDILLNTHITSNYTGRAPSPHLMPKRDAVHRPPSRVLVILLVGCSGCGRGHRSPEPGREDGRDHPAYRHRAQPRITEQPVGAGMAPGGAVTPTPHQRAALPGLCRRWAKSKATLDVSLAHSRSSPENGTSHTCQPGHGTGPRQKKELFLLKATLPLAKCHNRSDRQ